VLVEKQYDVIIIGAGPAGSTAALALSGSGLRVAVLDKHTFPRDKICGDAVANYVPMVLNSINPRFGEALNSFDQKVVVDTCRFVAPNQNAFDITYDKGGFIAMRLHWDNFLYELAAAQSNTTFYLNHEVKDLNIDVLKNEVSLVSNATLFKSKIVIGCDGAHSVVSKKLTTTKLDLKHHSGAVRAYYKNIAGIPQKTFELHFIKDLLPGYFWIFPVGDTISNVGLGCLSQTIAKKKVNLRETLLRITRDVPYISERFKDAELLGDIKGFGLPLGSRKVAISGNNFMLCGDAASLIDPARGEGIGQAMVSGRYAGWHARKCFERADFSAAFMKQYDKLVYDKFWAANRSHYWVQKLLMGNERNMNRVFAMASRSRFFKDQILGKLI